MSKQGEQAIRYEFVYFESVWTDGHHAWHCSTRGGGVPLGKLIIDKGSDEFVYYQPYEALLTRDQIIDIGMFLHYINS